jgi:predicted CXXCH cytochrome family protein
MKPVVWITGACLGLVLGNVAIAGGVADSPHNLSATGPGAVRAASESAVCKFCHTPHNAKPKSALWNRRNPGVTYEPYTSSTALAKPGQPTGTSLLCLSCHDGTIALGELLDRRSSVRMAGGVTTIPPGRAKVGTDLRHHHPVSFVYDASLASRRGELKMPAALSKKVKLDSAGQMQCTSCHDPHDNDLGAFLVMPNNASRLCVECHQKEGWAESSHGESDAKWNGQGRNPWPNSKKARSVSENACRNCHETHQKGGGRVLLRSAAEEENCSACHNGNVAQKNVMASFQQYSAHPVTNTTQAHDPGEAAIIDVRHVECSDCHNPHQGADSGGELSETKIATARRPPPVRGVSLGKSEVKRASRGYEICLRCHGDSPGKKEPRVKRQLDDGNIRLEIQQSSPSFHPIASPGRNPNVPSLIAPLTPQSIMDCMDCHNSNEAGIGGPSGPHGSAFEPILAMNYITADNTPESATAYALCYSCHSRDSILADESFAGHSKHIRDESTPCSVCHDAHGVSVVKGTPMNNSHLMNFDTAVVTPNALGNLYFEDQGRYAGSCSLSCHGKDHQNEEYTCRP